MLVVTRTIGESIVIPQDGITITILGLRERDKPHLDPVRIGIKAPHDVLVLRGELAVRKPAEHKT